MSAAPTAGMARLGSPVGNGPTTLTPYAAEVEQAADGDPADEDDERARDPRRDHAQDEDRRDRQQADRQGRTGWCPAAPRSGLASWIWIGPLAPGTPSSLGSWPMMIVIARPKTKPVTTDFARKSEMNPSRAKPAARRTTPTTRASPPSAPGSEPRRRRRSGRRPPPTSPPSSS